MDRNALITCFQDTQEQAVSKELRKRTQFAICSSKVYKEGFISKSKCNHQSRCFVEVESTTTFAEAKRNLHLGRVAVLNFANPEVPGGGVRNGAMAQEECLCRSSNLYSCLVADNVRKDYYEYNKSLHNHFFSDRLIYTRDVTVFKNDEIVPQMMPQSEWFSVDVITCAAPYLGKRKHTNVTALKNLFKRRIKNIFEAAIDNSADVLILGAFGCGAFKNPPKLVAEAFYEVVDENDYTVKFKKIVFAIKPTGEHCPNLSAFSYRFDSLCEDAQYRTTFLVPSAISELLDKTPPIVSNSEPGKYQQYHSWKWNNRYREKNFSILGDSISTLNGFNPRGYAVFYAGENRIKTGVSEMSDTWWGKVIEFLGGDLLVNNSWSGSRVTKLPDKDKLFPSGCSDDRTSSLHINDTMPDVIIVYLGTNDWARGVDAKSSPGHEKHLTEYFDAAYTMMLSKLRANYPDAEICCCTLCNTFISEKPKWKFPYKYGGVHIDTFNEIIRHEAASHGCRLIDLAMYGWPYDSVDGSHPNAAGMDTIATMVIRELAGAGAFPFLDCQNIDHHFQVVEEYTGGTKYVCKKCGRVHHTTTLRPPGVSSISEGTQSQINSSKESGMGTDNASKKNNGDIKQFVDNLYGQMDPKMREKIFYGNSDVARDLLIKISSGVFGKASEDNLTLCRDLYVQVWVRSHGGFQPVFSTPTYIREALIRRFPFLPQEKVIAGIDISLSYIYEKDPAIKEKILQIEFHLAVVKQNAEKNKHLEDAHLNDSDYGLCAEKPIFVNGFDGAQVYLSSLRTLAGSALEYQRLGSMEIEGIAGPVDQYDIKSSPTNLNCIIFICNYGTKNSIKAPRGFCLDKEGDAGTENGGHQNGETTTLPDNIRITVKSTGDERAFAQPVIRVGREEKYCDLFITGKPGISRIHATFARIGNDWFVEDANSKNGTWLNGKKLEPGTQHKLHANDQVDLAHQETLIFYQTGIKQTDKATEEQQHINMLLTGMATFAESGHKDELSLKLILFSLSKAPLYMPVTIDLEAMFGNLDPATLKAGDIIKPNKDVRMKVLTVSNDNGQEFIPLFTSSDIANKVMQNSIVRYHPSDYVAMLVQMDKPAVVNPFTDTHFILSQELIKNILVPLVNDPPEQAKSENDNACQPQMIGMEIEGKYRITKLLGSGGQFEMYLALNIHTGQTVAIKSYDKKRKGFNAQFYSIVMQEADMMRTINHPCAPRVYDLIENEQFLFMVREYIEGKTLSAISDEYGALSENQVVSWAKDICEGLKYLHAMNPPRIHRDIKPQNILLTTDGKIKIIDFGLMKCFDPSEKEDAIVLGTVGYAPPEQYSGRTDARTDIYALGITMHQLVTGVVPNRPPYEAKPIRQINPALSKKLEKIIAKCIEKDPAKRYQSCEDLLMALSDEKPGFFSKWIKKA